MATSGSHSDAAPLKEILRASREERGLSQEELARQVGVHRNSVKKWERGATPGLEIVAKLAAALGIPISRLVPHAGRPDSPELQAARDLVKKLAPAIAGIQQALRAVTDGEED